MRTDEEIIGDMQDIAWFIRGYLATRGNSHRPNMDLGEDHIETCEQVIRDFRAKMEAAK